MSQNKQTRKELLEVNASLIELERAMPYLKGEYYKDRKESLETRRDEITEKVEGGELAPDIQYIIKDGEDE
jgi:hypothetical protein